VLKEKMEKKEKEKNQTKKHAMGSRPESVAVVGMDEEELEALAGVSCPDACGSWFAYHLML
jgi:hypothetical protein